MFINDFDGTSWLRTRTESKRLQLPTGIKSLESVSFIHSFVRSFTARTETGAFAQMSLFLNAHIIGLGPLTVPQPVAMVVELVAQLYTNTLTSHAFT